MSVKVITKGLVRFSFPNVFEAKAMNDKSEPKFSVSVLLSKKDNKVAIKQIEDAVEEVKAECIKKYGGKLPKNFKLPLKDGDEEREDDEAYAGHMYFSATSKQKPGLVDADVNPIIDRQDFYAGCYGRVSVNVYAFDIEGVSKGIAIGLNNIQKLQDGERLAGGASAEEDFGSDDDMMS